LTRVVTAIESVPWPSRFIPPSKPSTHLLESGRAMSLDGGMNGSATERHFEVAVTKRRVTTLLLPSAHLGGASALMTVASCPLESAVARVQAPRALAATPRKMLPPQ